MRKLDLIAVTYEKSAYAFTDFVIIVAPINYDTQKTIFDTSVVEVVFETILKVNPNSEMIISPQSLLDIC